MRERARDNNHAAIDGTQVNVFAVPVSVGQNSAYLGESARCRPTLVATFGGCARSGWRRRGPLGSW